MVDRIVKERGEGEMEEEGRKGVEAIVTKAIGTKVEVSDGVWKQVNRLPESEAKSEVGKRRREIVGNRVVKICSKGEMKKGLRERREWLIEGFATHKVGEGSGEKGESLVEL